jgi:hypothetical protein
MDAKAELLDWINRYDWFHTIDFGDGVASPGHRTSAVLKAKADSYFSLSPKGRTVLDSGYWDGYFGDEALRRAAGGCCRPTTTSGTRNGVAGLRPRA